MKDFKPTLLDRAVAAVSPAAGMRRLAARQVLHEFSYDGARSSHKRNSAPQNISPNSFDVQRDRLQLMREAEDLERNFAPAKHLNRKYALYTAPISYHAATGDPELDKAVEAYLNDEVFPNCDVTGRFDFFKMMEFGIMGCNRGGDYGWAFLRPELEEGMTEDDAVNLDLKIQAVEPDRIGGIYQNVVSNDYVSGLIIGAYGGIDAFRVFHRSMTTSVYDNPVDIPSDQFVHMTDPMRIDQYRGVSVLATAVQNLRDIYEMVDFVKGKAKLASALTVFTNSDGGHDDGQGFDAYSKTLPGGSGTGMQQDIQFGQINHMQAGADIKFPSSNSPSSEEQALITLLLKFVAMSYNLPYSFALDASTLGGVSSRLESEMAKAEFERGQRVISPHAHRIKDAYLVDAIAKGIFPVEALATITKGRWGYRPHPQPDIGKEASAAVNLHQNGMLNPMEHWIGNGQDPEEVAAAMVRWSVIKRDAAKSAGFTAQEVFGAGPAMPLSTSESVTQTMDENGQPMGAGPKSTQDEGDEVIAEGAVAAVSQDAGLNGAQVASLSGLASKVSTGEMPVDSAKGLAIAAFPSIPPETIDRIFDQLVKATEPESEFSRHEFAESDRSLNAKIAKMAESVEFADDWVKDIREGLNSVKPGDDPEEVQRIRVELDKATAYLAEHKAALDKLNARRDRRDKKKPSESEPDAKAKKAKTQKSKERNERHALVVALEREGKSEKEALAIAYDIMDKGQFSWSKLPSDIQESYKFSRREFAAPGFDESKHPRGEGGKFGPGGSGSSSGSEKPESKESPSKTSKPEKPVEPKLNAKEKKAIAKVESDIERIMREIAETKELLARLG